MKAAVLFLPLVAFATVVGCDSDQPLMEPSQERAALHTDVDSVTGMAQSAPADFESHVVLQPAGHTVLANFDGSTKAWTGWTQGADWADNERVSVVSDPVSKHGQVIEKRWFAGETYGGWKGLVTRNIGRWDQLYVRLVFAYAPNWRWHPGGGKFVYLHNTGSGSARRNLILGVYTNGNPFGGASAGRRPGVWDFSSGARQAYPSNIPDLTRGQYHTVEWLIDADPNDQGGRLRMAVDGVLAEGEYIFLGNSPPEDRTMSSINWLYSNGVPDKRIGNLTEAFVFNGGSGGTVPANTYIRLSEFYISGRN